MDLVAFVERELAGSGPEAVPMFIGHNIKSEGQQGSCCAAMAACHDVECAVPAPPSSVLVHLAGMDAGFDLPFLSHHASSANLPSLPAYQLLDTRALAQKVLPGLQSRSLEVRQLGPSTASWLPCASRMDRQPEPPPGPMQALYVHFEGKAPSTSHQAMADVRTNETVMLHLWKAAGQSGLPWEGDPGSVEVACVLCLLGSLPSLGAASLGLTLELQPSLLNSADITAGASALCIQQQQPPQPRSHSQLGAEASSSSAGSADRGMLRAGATASLQQAEPPGRPRSHAPVAVSAVVDGDADQASCSQDDPLLSIERAATSSIPGAFR